ncbi:tail fiber domain-containing protein [Akkermansiaceae bacterium]|nr:tail fiber domain-containing protein [Akkermansiaceae bacterium]
MSDYTITTDFGAKDSLPSGNAAKVIKGSEFTTEFTNIKTAVNTKADTVSPTFTGAVTFDATVTNNSTVTNNAAVTVNSTATITGDLTVDTNTLFVDVSENRVGIGTTSPDYTLDIEADTAQARIHSTVGNSVLRLDSVDAGESKIFFADNSASAIGTIEYHHDSNYMSFDTVATERMRIDSSGNVGIGTSSPQDLLHINSDTTDARLLLDGHTGFDAELKFAENGSVKYTVGHDAATDSFRIGTANVDTNPRLVIDASGNLLVGKTSSGSTIEGAELHNSGSVFAVRDGHPVGVFDRKTTNGDVVQFRRDGTTVGSVSATSSATSYNTSSDERLKENITDSADAGSKVDAIQIRQFDWKADGLHQDYGVIAQELVEVAPEAVHQPEDSEDMMGVDYSKLVPMLIKEVQSLRSRVAELENV